MSKPKKQPSQLTDGLSTKTKRSPSPLPPKAIKRILTGGGLAEVYGYRNGVIREIRLRAKTLREYIFSSGACS